VEKSQESPLEIPQEIPPKKELEDISGDIHMKGDIQEPPKVGDEGTIVRYFILFTR
jgi:hypothetical protein